MAKLSLVFQAATKARHADEIVKLLTLPKLEYGIFSVAFVREAGVAAFTAALRPVAPKVKVFVGVRNDITSIQALRSLLDLKVELYAVDTGSRRTIFHPKLYLSANASAAKALIGSANATHSGLHNNLEISTSVDLDLSSAEDKAFVLATVKSFADFLAAFPSHVLPIKSDADILALFDTGRLADETAIRAPSISKATKHHLDTVPPMGLHWIAPPVPSFAPSSAKVKTTKGKGTAAGGALVAPEKTDFVLVWQSKPLSERDLSIPKGKTTNPTGSMGWKKGALEGIDQRHYFRDEIFRNVPWHADGKHERATALFSLIIKNIHAGDFQLLLSHNTDVKSATYRQKNFMTQLHWGEAISLIRKDDLLERTLYLYRKDTTPPEFMIEID